MLQRYGADILATRMKDGDATTDDFGVLCTSARVKSWWRAAKNQMTRKPEDETNKQSPASEGCYAYTEPWGWYAWYSDVGWWSDDRYREYCSNTWCNNRNRRTDERSKWVPKAKGSEYK